jgi:zinc D-Ala-D-Ala carboxypeptidase
MTYGEPRTAARRTRSAAVAALLVVSAAPVGVVLHRSLASPSSSIASSNAIPHGDPHGPPGEARPRQPPRERSRSGATTADGVVPDGVTVFDDDFPAVANLDPDLLDALRRPAADAEDDGVGFVVNSGWRSPAYQEQLLREAISEYGSAEEAARWVATVDKSAHVSGDAVDIGPAGAAAWLSQHGGEYGLCQIYDNEPWHYELRPEAGDEGCPPRYADPTQDPRMR